MNNESIRKINLEKHDTKDIVDKHTNGSLTVVWRDWDNIIKFDPKMIYTSTVFPGEIKGPHLHKKRDSFFVCISGKVLFIIKNNDDTYTEIESSEENPIMIEVPKGVPSAHINQTTKNAIILTIANISWRPNDNEMENVSFDNYSWNKQK